VLGDARRSANQDMTSLQALDYSAILSVDEVLRRATAEFGFLQCDADRGVRYAARKLLKTSPNLTHDEKDHQMATLMQTIELILGDDRHSDKHFLKCVVMPNGLIDVLYLYDSHEAMTKSLLERLSRILGYTIVPN
jgi:hypothetical protein